MPRVRQYTSEPRAITYRLLRENPAILETQYPAAEVGRRLREIEIKVDASLVRRFVRNYREEAAETRLEPASPAASKGQDGVSSSPPSSALVLPGQRAPLVVGHREANLTALRAEALQLAEARWPDLEPHLAQQRGAILFSLVRGSTRDAARKRAKVKPPVWAEWLRDPAWLEEVEAAEGEAVDVAADRLHSASEVPAYWFAALRWLERRTLEFAPKQEININQRIEGEFDVRAILARPDAPKLIDQISELEAGWQRLERGLAAHEIIDGEATEVNDEPA